MLEESSARFIPLIVVVNAAIVGVALVAVGWLAKRRGLTAGVPGPLQNAGEAVLDFFVGRAASMAEGDPHKERVMRIVTPFLASFFLFIIASNAIGMLPVPMLNVPPTANYSATLALALCSVIGTLVISVLLRGPVATAKHLFWPNPMQWVSEITDVLSLSLRLFGNIAGEYLALLYVLKFVPYGIPLILHGLGLIPVFVQALVFTLLTASFLSAAIRHEEKRHADETGEAPVSAAPVVGRGVG